VRTGNLILGLTLAAWTAPAQVPATDAAGELFRLSTTAELVLLDVGVKDAAGERISNLTQAAFRVYDDGKLQRITHFSADDVPVTVGLVIDTSGSMRPKHNQVVTAALSFLRGSNRQDEVFVVNFGDRATSGLPADVPFSADIGQLRTALSWATPAGRTALYDGIQYALHHLEKGTRAKKTLLLVSDGGDNASTHHAADTLRAVRESRATIYTIGLFDEGDADRNPALLRGLAQVSGGESFLPKEVAEVEGICGQIAADIRTRYTIGYTPVRNGEEGSLRRIKVTATSPGGHKLVVHTRSSYVLPPGRKPVQ
jgi:Ca-activated chloride channel homolog